jgi:hypothetical protein
VEAFGLLEPQAARRERTRQTATRRMFKLSPKVIQVPAGYCVTCICCWTCWLWMTTVWFC